MWLLGDYWWVTFDTVHKLLGQFYMNLAEHGEVPVYAMKAYSGSRGMSPLLPNIANSQ